MGRRAVTCWWSKRPGHVCGSTLTWHNHRWVCPHGHPLRDVSRWLRTQIEVTQGDPARIQRYFGDIT